MAKIWVCVEDDPDVIEAEVEELIEELQATKSPDAAGKFNKKASDDEERAEEEEALKDLQVAWPECMKSLDNI
jgi:hypothetical protein